MLKWPGAASEDWRLLGEGLADAGASSCCCGRSWEGIRWCGIWVAEEVSELGF